MARRIVIFGWAGSVHVERWARGLVQRGHQVRVISLGDQPIADIDTVILPRTGRWSYFRYADAAARAARHFNPDIIHAHYAAGFGMWALYAGHRPWLVSVWGSDVVEPGLNPFYRLLLKRIFKYADRVTATSRYLSQAVLDIAPSINDKVDVIPFGVRIPPSCPPLPQTGPINLCFAKNHKMIYGPDVLLRAFSLVRKAIPDIMLNIAGEGEATPVITKMMVDLGLEKNIRLVGFIENDKLYDFYERQHIMIMPSYQEAFGVAALEASACGRPVIASNVGGVPEVLVDGVTGLLVPKGNHERLAEAIIKLASDADLMSKMGRVGYDFVRANYSWEKSLDLMTDLYERLIYARKNEK